MQHEFDVAVIGSGSAGTNVALAARKTGQTVAVIEERPFGGTCALRGCDPKKVLVAATRVLQDVRNWNALGVFDSVPRLDWARLMRFRHTFTDPVPDRRRQTYVDAGIVPVPGHAQFIDRQLLRVGEDLIRAEHILIATGAKERHVATGDGILHTSDTFLELESLPASLVFVGGGYITFELAHVAARAGSRVTILHSDAHPLRGFDTDIVARLVAATRRLGIDVQLKAMVTSVEMNQNGVIVHAVHEGTERAFHAASGVLAAGRVPNLTGLSLEVAGVEYTPRGVKVNERLQSVSNPSVFAAGDVADNGGLPLTPVAGYEGEIVAANMLHDAARVPDFGGLVTIVYTIPPLASVGVTEASAREQGLEIDVYAGDMNDWYSTRHLAQDEAAYKAVVDKRTGTLLGATIFGPHAEEQINVLALAIRNGLDARRVADTLFGYPTGSSDLEYLVS